jgi:hypothetical protein
MSLRPYFNGFDRQKMLDLFGSGSRTAKDSAFVIIGGMLTGDDPEILEGRRKCSAVITEAIDRGVPFPGLDGEDESHVCAAAALAEMGQSFFRPDPNDDSWKISLMEVLLAQNEGRFDSKTHELLSFIRDGRPLFGKRIDTGWSYYAWLTSAEVRELAAGIRKAQEVYPGLADPGYFDGFLLALLGWLDKITERNMDLWLYTG